MKNKSLFIALTSVLFAATPTAAKAADAYWLDQYNSLLYLSTFQLDKELKEMSQEGANTLLLHADSLPLVCKVTSEEVPTISIRLEERTHTALGTSRGSDPGRQTTWNIYVKQTQAIPPNHLVLLHPGRS